MFAVLLKPHITIFFFAFSLLIAVFLLYPSSSSTPQISVSPHTLIGNLDIWSVPRIIEWRPCKWWQQGDLSTLPAKSNGYIRVDCYGGLNQMRRDLCDGVGIARLLNATLVLPKFEVAAYWNESSGFADVFDADYFILQLNTFIEVVKDLPTELRSMEPFHVDCSKRKGHFDYIESVLPLLLQHRYISFTPSMSQRRDRYPLYAKASVCKACYNALRLTPKLEKKASQLLRLIPKPFLSLHLRFEPDMVVYSQCEYTSLSSASISAIHRTAISHQRPTFSNESAHLWRSRGKCPLTPNETAFILTSLAIPSNTTIYLAAGDGIMELEGLKSVYRNVLRKDDLMVGSGGDSRAALDYYVSIHADAYVGSFFGNMDKMVGAMRVVKGLYKTLFLNRRVFAEVSGMGKDEAREKLWRAHVEDFKMGRGSALPDYCFCEFKL